MHMLRAIEQEADKEAFYNAAKKFGERAAHSQALGERKRSQLTGLESIASSSLKVTDVFDYIKLRTARQSEWRHNNLGQELLIHLETQLVKIRDDLCLDEALQELSGPEKQEIYRRLIQAFIAHLVAQYEFILAETKGKGVPRVR
jgi:hypothetical protein